MGNWVNTRPIPAQAGRHARFPVRCATLALLSCIAATASAQPTVEPPPADPPVLHFLVIDDRHVPHVRVSWETEGGDRVVLEADRHYQAPAERTPLGGNLDCFVALGGTRLDKQAGDPDGAIVRVGLYKHDPTKPLFEGLVHESPIEIVLTNIVFDKPALASAESGVQHIKYSQDALAECGLAGAAFELYNTVSPTDDLRGKVTSENGRLGVLGTEGSEFTVTAEPDGSFTLRATIPYALLRHVKDPWQLTKPGTFLEPLHFHVEFEAIPANRAPEAVPTSDPVTNPPSENPVSGRE